MMLKPYYETPLGKLYHGDCLEIMPQLELVDLVLTDPPYGINKSSGTVNLSRGKGEYVSSFSDDEQYYNTVVIPAIKFFITISTGCVVMASWKYFDKYPPIDSFGCFYQPAGVGLQSFGWADGQPIFYYGKNPTKKNMGKKCSYQVTEKPSSKEHPCAKPIGVWSEILRNTSLEMQTVLDPFLGSGTTCVSADLMGRRWIGIEREKEYIEIAKCRIIDEARQIKLF